MSGPATPRTTPALVEGIIETEVGVDLSPFIAAGNQLCTRACGASGYTDGFVGSEMEIIERWLSAHFYTIFDNQLARARAGSVDVSYQFKVGFDLRNSMYGQAAMMLDTAGNLAAIENSNLTRKKVTLKLRWLGKHRKFWAEDVVFLDGWWG